MRVVRERLSKRTPDTADPSKRRPLARRRFAVSDLKRPSVMALIVANLIPLYGVIFLKWEVFPLIFLYWSENVIVGFYNVLKMASTPPYDLKTWIGKAFVIPFFCIHYGMFTAVHGIFVMAIFGGLASEGAPFPGPAVVAESIKKYGLVFPAVVLFLSHGFSFFWNFLGKGEYKKAGFKDLMASPYSRIVVLHITIIFGGFLLMALGSPLVGLIFFLILKISFDLAAHMRQHKMGTTPP
jgi:hypothetical protein